MRLKSPRRISYNSVLVIVLGFIVVALAGCGGGAASPSQVAQAANASYCDNSGYYIQSKLTNQKDLIYDCRFGSRQPRCVTYSGNIANNATAEVSLLFSSAIGRRPPCLRWSAQWAARKQAEEAAARLARKRANYREQIALDRQIGWHNGYTAWDGNPYTYTLPTIYYKWMNGNYSCPSYDTALGYPCWKVEIVTRNYCSNLSVEAGEHATDSSTSPNLGTILGNGGASSTESPSVVELDGDTTAAQWAFITSITCD